MELKIAEYLSTNLKQRKQGRVILACALAGMVFGFVFSLVGMVTGIFPETTVSITTILISNTLLAGLGGVVNMLLDVWLQRIGVQSTVTRRVLGFSLSALTIILVMILVFASYGILNFEQIVIWGTTLGLVFGGAIGIIDYRMFKIRRQLETLEMQNRYLLEIAEKDELLASAARDLAVTEERNRLARELHDSISQGIHGTVYFIHTLRNQLDREGVGGDVLLTLNHLEKTAEVTLSELRAMVMELKPATLAEKGLKEAMKLHCDLFSHRQGIEIALTFDLPKRLEPEMEMAIYRITQEALANIQKHAGASRVEVALVTRDRTVTLQITDNGCGFDPQTVQRGSGLDNMTARARNAGGICSIVSSAGQGTIITVEFPF